MRKFFVLVNPASGTASKHGLVDKIRGFLGRSSIEFEIFHTERKGHGTELVSQHLDRSFTDLMVVGGDGTINEAVNGLGYLEVPISLLSVGTGNDFSKALKLPNSLQKQLKIALHGKVVSVDAGKCNNHLFVNTIGFGFDGKVVEYIDRHGKPLSSGLWRSIPASGHLAYLFTVLKIVTKFSEPLVRFTVDGKELEQPVFLMAINNGTVYGGGFKITPDAKLDDGVLDICLIGKISPLRRLLNFPKMQLGIHQNVREITMLRAKRIEVFAQPEVVAQIDGELMGTPPFTIEALPKALRFRVSEK